MKIAWMDQAPEQWLEKFRFFTPIQVRFSDTDQLGHINNVSYFSYFEYGRIAYLEALDLTKSLLDASQLLRTRRDCHRQLGMPILKTSSFWGESFARCPHFPLWEEAVPTSNMHW